MLNIIIMMYQLINFTHRFTNRIFTKISLQSPPKIHQCLEKLVLLMLYFFIPLRLICLYTNDTEKPHISLLTFPWVYQTCIQPNACNSHISLYSWISYNNFRCPKSSLHCSSGNGSITKHVKLSLGTCVSPLSNTGYAHTLSFSFQVNSCISFSVALDRKSVV